MGENAKVEIITGAIDSICYEGPQKKEVLRVNDRLTKTGLLHAMLNTVEKTKHCAINGLNAKLTQQTTDALIELDMYQAYSVFRQMDEDFQSRAG